jgi:hypothetical protein
MKKQKELDRLTKELVKQMTGNEVEDPQEGDYQIAYYYLSKAMDYTRCCTELKDKEEMTFEEWLRVEDINKHQDGTFYISSERRYVELTFLINRYNSLNL